MQKILFLLPLILALLVSGTVEAKKKKYPNGDYYEGEWKKGQPDGFGKMIYANGNVYEGNWENGLPNGEGKMTYKGGGIYEGMFPVCCDIIEVDIFTFAKFFPGVFTSGVRSCFR